jgi:uncharacterized integral membrane protein
MNNRPENSDLPPITQLIAVTVAIICIAAILLQNLQPLVTIYFLGQATIPIPLSVAILAAFLCGAIVAAIANSVANLLSRSNDAIANSANNFVNPESRSNKDSGVKDNPQQTPKRTIQDDDDLYTDYPRSGRKTTIQNEEDDDDDDDDDNRDEIYVKYIRK